MLPLDMPDDEFLATFERGAFSAHAFGHAAHLRMAYLYIERLGAAAAEDRVTAGIRNLAATHGHAEKYHETLSLAWVRVVALAMAHAHPASFDALLAAHPALLDKNLLLRHWSPAALFGPRAYAEWVEPDLLPIPTAAA